MTAVIYHGGCVDGWTAAWIAHRALEARGHAVELVAGVYGETPPTLDGHDDIFLVDFAYPHDKLVELTEGDRRVMVLDHHRSAMDRIVAGLAPWFTDSADEQPRFLDIGNLGPYRAILDMDRSGAGITWDYFHPDEPRPPLVNYVEDRDLWRAALPLTEAVAAFVASQEHTLDSWDALTQVTVEDMASAGFGALAHIAAYCRSAATHAYWCQMHDRVFPIVNVTHEAASDVASYLLDEYNTDMAGYFFERAGGGWQYGFRSRGDVTVHDLAERFGGGGHPRASGCETAEIAHRRVDAPA